MIEKLNFKVTFGSKVNEIDIAGPPAANWKWREGRGKRGRYMVWSWEMDQEWNNIYGILAFDMKVHHWMILE